MYDIKELAKECSREWKRARSKGARVTMSTIMTRILEKHELTFVADIRRDIGKELNRMRQAARHRDKETEKHLEAEARYLIGNIRPLETTEAATSELTVDEIRIAEHLHDPNVQHFLRAPDVGADDAEPWLSDDTDDAMDKAS